MAAEHDRRKAAEEQQKAAELAESLAALSLQEGAGALIWGRVIKDALASHTEARKQFLGKTAKQSTFERIYGTAYVIVTATDQVLRTEKRIRKLTGDAELAKARQKFHDRAGHSVEAVRDLAMHLDEYSVGKGHRQTGKANAATPVRRRVQTSLIWTDNNESYFSIGEDQVSVERTAHAAVELAQAVERVRLTQQRNARRRYHAASDKLYGSFGEPEDPQG
jgi:hypothetical protein